MTLFDAEGSANTNAIVLAADDLRRRTVGDVVTYVINRNINFTNVCIKHCGFCAFSRDHREEEGYFLPEEEIVRRAREAWDLGATRGLHPGGPAAEDEGRLLHRADAARSRSELPDMHIHGFSPEEVLYGVDPLALLDPRVPAAAEGGRRRHACRAPRRRSSTRRCAT